ncbi:hypothetical protein TWF506_009290 [Arthrobotrys conoides]|uniref:Uncharacterized protein n=1 Tax=Arthrobotrys conoides TaxID=74498 RepID=A0AAN8NKL6_9PEZI
MVLIGYLLLLHSRHTTASWLLNFPVGWTEESAISQPPHIRPITARYECTVFNFNRWSLPLEATTIYNAPNAFATNAIAYYRNSKCKDEDGDGLDYVIILDPENSKGVNVVDLKLDGLTVGGTPTSYQAVEYMHYAKVIKQRTGKPPKAGSVYVFGARGAVTAWSSEVGVVKNVDLGEYTTPEGLKEIEKDPKEMSLVLGMITEKVLSEDAGRARKLRGFVQKKLGGQTAGYNLPEMLEKMKEYEEGLKGRSQGFGFNMGFGGVPGQMGMGIQMPMQGGGGMSNPNRRGNLQGQPMGPPNMQPNRGFNEGGQSNREAPITTPYELANRPINLYKLTNECIKAGKNRVLWLQWYWAEYWFQSRLVKAALHIFELFEKGGIEAVKKFMEESEEGVLRKQREEAQNWSQMSTDTRGNLLAQARQTIPRSFNPGENMGQGNANTNPGRNSVVQPPGTLNLPEQIPVQDIPEQIPVQSIQNPTGQSAEQSNPEQEDEVIILGSIPPDFETPFSLPQFSRQSSGFDRNLFANQLPNLNNLAGKSGLASFTPSLNQFSPGPFGMTVAQGNDLAAVMFDSFPSDNQVNSVAEMLRTSGWTGGDTPSMISDFLDPVFQAGNLDLIGDTAIRSRKETPKKKLKPES